MFGYTFMGFFLPFLPRESIQDFLFPSLEDEAILKVGLLFRKALE